MSAEYKHGASSALSRGARVVLARLPIEAAASAGHAIRTGLHIGTSGQSEINYLNFDRSLFISRSCAFKAARGVANGSV